MIQLSAYELPDAKLIADCRIKAPKIKEQGLVEHHVMQYGYTGRAVVLGASNKLEDSVNIQACISDQVPVFKRPSGGEAVLISDGSLLFSHIMLGTGLPASKDYFSQNLRYFINALQARGVKDLYHRGISDLSIKDRKILGCAIYRTEGFLLFQAVLNLSESALVIARYLAQPGRMPDYRLGRSHQDFVSSLKDEGYDLSLEELDVCAELEASVTSVVYRH